MNGRQQEVLPPIHYQPVKTDGADNLLSIDFAA